MREAQFKPRCVWLQNPVLIAVCAQLPIIQDSVLSDPEEEVGATYQLREIKLGVMALNQAIWKGRIWAWGQRGDHSTQERSISKVTENQKGLGSIQKTWSEILLLFKCLWYLQENDSIFLPSRELSRWLTKLCHVGQIRRKDTWTLKKMN